MSDQNWAGADFSTGSPDRGVYLCRACERRGDCRLGLGREELLADGSVETTLICTAEHEGGPGVAHGGWTAPMMKDKIWANSGDSHFLEPTDVFTERMPAALAERMPRSVKSPDGTKETVYIDGESFDRPLPKPIKDGEFAGQTIETLSARPPGAMNTNDRLKDLDQEGIWGEVTFPSLGMWANMIRDTVLVREGAKAVNDW